MKLFPYVHLRNIHNSTGAGRVARNLVEQLHLIGRDEIRILCDPRDRARILPQVGAPWTGYSYEEFKLETSKQQALWLFTDRPPAEKYWPEAEVVFCTGEAYVPTRKARSIVTMHDAAYFEESAHAATLSSWKQSLKWRILHGKLSRKTDLIHTVSQFSADRLEHFFPAMKGRLRVVHNGATDLFFEPVDEEGEAGLEALGLKGREYALLPRGLAYRKNADLVLEAWPKIQAMHPDLLLVISSHSTESYAEKARALGDTVRIVGFVEDTVLRSLYHAARVVWYPSLYEGFGIPLVEAMLCGAPLVASDSSSIPEVSGDAALLVDPHDVNAHVDAIDSLLRDESARTDLIARGHARGRQFTWRAAAEKLRTYLHELV